MTERNGLGVGDFIEERYEIVRVLGQGGMGLVHLVRDRKRPDYFAVKSIKPKSQLSPRYLTQFLREAELWAGLGGHPHIVQVMSVNRETESRPLIFLEYVDGTSLRGIMQGTGTPIPFPRILDYAIQICEGIAYAHEHGIVHRDLKPENVLISFDSVKVTDFGLASVLRKMKPAADALQGEPHPIIAGTLPYMPLEQLLGEEDVGPSADVYSFGVMLYELVAGHRPFSGNTIEDLIRAQRKNLPLAPSTFSDIDLSPTLDRTIMACLSPDPIERPHPRKIAEELKNDYEVALDSLGDDRSDRRQALVQRAISLNNAHQSRPAIATLKEVVDEDPRNVDAWHLLGNAFMDIAQAMMLTHDQVAPNHYEATGHYRTGIRCAERAIALYPEHDWACNTKGACLMAIGYFNKALQSLERALEITPSYAVAWRTRGICLRRQGRISEALASFDHSLALEPNNANALNGKGVCLALLDRYKEAVACFDWALTIAPNHIQALGNRRLWADIGAGRIREMAIVRLPNQPEIDEHICKLLGVPAFQGKGGRPARDCEAADLSDRAWGLMNVGLLDEAEKVIGQAISIDPQYSTAWLQRGKILRRSGRFAEAVAAFQKVREIDPKYAFGLLNEGLARVEMDQLDEAFDLFNQYVSEEPDDSAGWNNRGLVLIKKGEYAGAIESFAKAVKVDPGLAMAWFNKAQCHLILNELQSAYDCCRAGLGVDPLRADGLLLLGEVELMRGRTHEALSAFRAVTELSPQLATGWAYRAALETSVEAVTSCCLRAEQLGFNNEEALSAARARGLLLIDVR